MTIRVLVVDDHPIFREGLAASLDAMPDILVVADAADGNQAVAAASRDEVDVVLMDLNLPTLSGVEATTQICGQPAPPAVLVITMVDDDDTVMAAMRAGARGYVLKGATSNEIGNAVRTVASGGAVFGAGVATRLLAAATGTGGVQTARDLGAAGLTERERDVLQLLAQGRNNHQIARSLGLTVKTVQNYVSRILDKLQVSDRTQAALWVRGDNEQH